MPPNRRKFCCDNLSKSIIMALKKPGKLKEFFSLFYATLVQSYCGIFNMATPYLFVSELNDTNIAVQEFFSTTVLSG